jgi:hypothetical protein
MRKIIYDQKEEIDLRPFCVLVGEEVISLIFDNAPRKVFTRVARSLEHYARSSKLEGVDEEMGAMRLIAAEEELVVAIFEWLKLNPESYPGHQDFVSKFKNHVVKLTFYPALLQFRFVLGDMLLHGLTMDGLEKVVNYTTKPVVDGKSIKLAIYDEDGKELIRSDPFAVNISRDDVPPDKIPQVLLNDFADTVKRQQGTSLREFLLYRAEFRNHLLYASDAGSAKLVDSLTDLRKEFERTFHDLLWALALIVSGKPPGKDWGIVHQFISVYRLALIEAKILRPDNTIDKPPDEG